MILTGIMVTRIFAPEPSAASLRLKSVKAGLERIGTRVRVFTTEPPAGVDSRPDSTICRVPVLRDKEGYVKGYLSYASFDIQAFFKLLTMPRVDFVLVEPPPTTGTVARLACAIRRIPYFWYAADVWSDATDSMDVPSFVKKTVRGLEAFAIRGALGCIAVSDGVSERVQSMGAKSVKVVPNGVDTDVFNPHVPILTPAQREQMGIKKPYFVYAGTASNWQGAELFAFAFEEFWEKNPEIQLLYLTRGESVPNLEKVASRLEARADTRRVNCAPLIVHKTVSPEEAAQWQREAIASCVSIQPEIGYDLAYPTKVLTALSCGTPVLYAGAGPAGEDLTRNDLGLAVPYSKDAICEAMGVLVESLAREEKWDPNRLHGWVSENRSMTSVGAVVARYIRDRIE